MLVANKHSSLVVQSVGEKGATALSIITVSIMTVSITTVSIMTVSITTVSITTISITTVSITTVSITCKSQNSGHATLVSESCYAECQL